MTLKTTYEDPNICYAIGDVFGAFIGTAETDRQPASGVFEQLSSLLKIAQTDSVDIYDGTTTRAIFVVGVSNNSASVDAKSISHSPFNMANIFGNTVYIRKIGTTDRFHISGVQIDA